MKEFKIFDSTALSNNIPVLEKYLITLIKKIIANMPEMKEIEYLAIQFIEFAFGPRQIFYHFVLVSGLQLGTAVYEYLRSTIEYFLMSLTTRGRKEIQLSYQLKHAKSYKEWKLTASQLDAHRGLHVWQDTDACSFYDYRILRKRISDLIEMIHNGDVFNLIFRLRGGLSRDQFGVMHEALFTKALAGTKTIVEAYHETVSDSLNFICDSPITEDEIPTDAKLAFFNETRHSYGRTALLLSGGAYLGFYHFGVARALWREGLLPRVISGASAGSLIAAMLGTRTNEELNDFFEAKDKSSFFLRPTPPTSIHTNMQFHKPSQATKQQQQYDTINTNEIQQSQQQQHDNTPHLMNHHFHVDNIYTAEHHNNMYRMDFLITAKIQSKLGKFIQKWIPLSIRWLIDPILSIVCDHKLLNIDNNHFRKVVRQNVGLYTFQEAFDRTGRIINITVAPLNHYDPPRVLNYLTAPHVCVWSAAVASCSIPGIFDSTSLIVKEPNGDFHHEHEWSRQGHSDEASTTPPQSYSDGSFDSDLPMVQISELFNTNHFIISQVNIHSAFLSSLFLPNPYWNQSYIFGAIVAYVRYLKAHVRDWIKNVITLIATYGGIQSWGIKRGLIQTITQDYEGREKDITIMPWKGHIGFLNAAINIMKNPSVEDFEDVMQAGERNTWPFISRIRAHCLVEMTLDKCVQRLRREIASQSLLKQQQMIATIQNGNTNIGRIPSFYTTRSLINLSGLSVADPLPQEYITTTTTANATTSTGNMNNNYMLMTARNNDVLNMINPLYDMNQKFIPQTASNMSLDEGHNTMYSHPLYSQYLSASFDHYNPTYNTTTTNTNTSNNSRAHNVTTTSGGERTMHVSHPQYTNSFSSVKHMISNDSVSPTNSSQSVAYSQSTRSNFMKNKHPSSTDVTNELDQVDSDKTINNYATMSSNNNNNSNTDIGISRRTQSAHSHNSIDPSPIKSSLKLSSSKYTYPLSNSASAGTSSAAGVVSAAKVAKFSDDYHTNLPPLTLPNETPRDQSSSSSSSFYPPTTINNTNTNTNIQRSNITPIHNTTNQDGNLVGDNDDDAAALFITKVQEHDEEDWGSKSANRSNTTNTSSSSNYLKSTRRNIPAINTTNPSNNTLKSNTSTSTTTVNSGNSPQKLHMIYQQPIMEDEHSLYASVVAPDTYLIDKPKSTLLSSRYGSIISPRVVMPRKAVASGGGGGSNTTHNLSASRDDRDIINNVIIEGSRDISGGITLNNNNNNTTSDNNLNYTNYTILRQSQNGTPSNVFGSNASGGFTADDKITGITKTTQMSNFYYKRSNSEEMLSKLVKSTSNKDNYAMNSNSPTSATTATAAAGSSVDPLPSPTTTTTTNNNTNNVGTSSPGSPKTSLNSSRYYTYGNTGIISTSPSKTKTTSIYPSNISPNMSSIDNEALNQPTMEIVGVIETPLEPVINLRASRYSTINGDFTTNSSTTTITTANSTATKSALSTSIPSVDIDAATTANTTTKTTTTANEPTIATTTTTTTTTTSASDISNNIPPISTNTTTAPTTNTTTATTPNSTTITTEKEVIKEIVMNI